jgi:glutathione S-transferase
MYTLYYSPGSASMCVHQALIEAHVPYTLELIDLKAGQQRDAAYLQLNPGGVVPTLLIDGTPFVESGALLLTLAMLHPHAGLAPDEGTLARAAFNQWIVYLANSLLPAYRMLFYAADLSAEPGMQASIKASAGTRIEAILTRIDRHLGSHGPYLLGSVFSAADLMLIMLLRWSRNLPKPATQWPSLNLFIELMATRPSWHKLHEIERLSEWPPGRS